jgi:hypothetical protein
MAMVLPGLCLPPRDVLYVRPGAFVVFDRTTVAKSERRPMAPAPHAGRNRQAATTDPTQRRFDVAAGKLPARQHSLSLPRNASATTTSLAASAARIEVHAPVRAASQQWLTVVTTGAATADPVRLSAADGNVAPDNLIGVEFGWSAAVCLCFGPSRDRHGEYRAD